MRCAAVLVLLTGCRAVLGLEPPQLVDASTPDTPNIDAVFDAPPQQNVCAADTNLIACFDFEGSAVDQAPSPNAVIGANISFSMQGVSGKAIVLDTASRVTIQDSVLLDTPSVTVEAWVYMTAPAPAAARSGVLDVNGQYGVFIKAGQVLACTPGAPAEGGVIPLNQWTHIACAASGGQAFAYINGQIVATAVYSAALATAPVDGGEIGGDNPLGDERFIGKLDVLRVYRVARTPQEICTDAGKQACQ